MHKPIISILIVNYNSSDFIEISLFALKKLTKKEYIVYIMDNNSSREDFNRLKKISENYNNTIIYPNKTNLKGSMAHGSALNELIKKVDTPYFSILDADATWLIKNWDEILINQMSDNIKVIGTQAPVGSGKYQDFPLMFSILFETETFNKLNVDFRPKNIQKNEDTGFEIREKYLKSGFVGKNLLMQNTRFYKNGPLCNVVCAEYYLDDCKEIFASHFGRGSSPFSKQKIKLENKLLSLLLMPINYLLYYKDKNKWIEECKNIIKNQI